MSPELVLSFSIILWEKYTYRIKEMKMTLIFSKCFHLSKNYYRYMLIALFVPCNFNYTNLLDPFRQIRYLR